MKSIWWDEFAVYVRVCLLFESFIFLYTYFYCLLIFRSYGYGYGCLAGGAGGAGVALGNLFLIIWSSFRRKVNGFAHGILLESFRFHFRMDFIRGFRFREVIDMDKGIIYVLYKRNMQWVEPPIIHGVIISFGLL